MKIALASSDGKRVDMHFGKADQFLIYELPCCCSESCGKKVLIETRAVEPFSDNVKNHDFNQSRFDKVYEAIKDCEKVFVVQIGEMPKAKLEEKGIDTVIYSGSIAGIV
ncbi:MAG: hypothetical protein A2Y41_02155 [Spirochaetes bacterium GWB1_36_13]|nr:MAG: hypothetical protein A2Y41_02155 [Spirochaetes bacterium GWB1_36_13]